MCSIARDPLPWSSHGPDFDVIDHDEGARLLGADRSTRCFGTADADRGAALLARLIALIEELAGGVDEGSLGPPLPPRSPARPPTPWLEVARGEIGERELRDVAHSARILEYHASTGGRFQDDETPWCSSFVNWVIEQAGFEGTDSARALSWRSYGSRCDQPVMGAIAVIDHGNGRGHVGFVVGRDGDRVVLLGGNQRNQVRYQAYPASAITEFRLPPGCSASSEPLPQLNLAPR